MSNAPVQGRDGDRLRGAILSAGDDDTLKPMAIAERFLQRGQPDSVGVVGRCVTPIQGSRGPIIVTRFTKKGGPLTKRIALDEDGKPSSDGLACTMSEGMAERIVLDDPQAFANLIEGLTQNQAIALGFRSRHRSHRPSTTRSSLLGSPRDRPLWATTCEPRAPEAAQSC